MQNVAMTLSIKMEKDEEYFLGIQQNGKIVKENDWFH